MSVNDLADLLIAARGRVDFYWNFYAVMVIAIIGWLVSPKRHFTVSMKLLVTVVYVLASSMNLLGLYSSYSLAEALRTDLVRAAADSPLANTRILLEQHSFELHRTAALGIHLVLAATIVFGIWAVRPADTAAPVAREPVPRQKDAPPKKQGKPQ
jgi:hypothetical protein